MGKQQEIEKRRKRADGLYVVFEDAEDFGIQASVRGPSGISYQVFVRGKDSPANYCSCPDFATNALGTCKHLEAALKALADKEPERLTSLEQTGARPVVHIDHTSRPLALRVADAGAGLPESLADLFDSQGILPEEKYETAAERFLHLDPKDILVLPEALTHLAQAVKMSRARRAAAALVAGLSADKKLAAQPEHVQQGVRFLLEKGRALLADDFGLDRPTQAALAVSQLTRAGLVQRCVVFCPETRRRHWQQLLIRRTGKRVSLFAGRTVTSPGQTFSSYPFLVSSYKDAARLVDTLSAYDPDLVILDEAHRIRRWNGPAAKAIKSLWSPLVFALAAPKVLDHPDQLYYLVQYLDSHVLGTPWEFSERYLARNRHGTVVGYEHVDELPSRLSGLMLHRDRSVSSAKSLKERIVVDSTSAQRTLMASPAASVLGKLKDSRRWTQTDRAELVAFLARLRKLANLLGAGLPAQSSPKGSELLAVIDQLPHGGETAPIIVFTRFRDAATALADLLTEAGLSALAVGTASDLPKLEDIAAPNFPDVVVLCDLLLDRVEPQAATAAVFLDVPWTPATVKARRKACRFQEKPGIEIEFILADSLEETVRKILVTNTQVLAEAIPDVVQELEALPSADPAALDRVLELVLDPHVLRSVVPANMPIPHGVSAQSQGAKKRVSQKLPTVRTTGPSGQRRTATSSSGGIGDIVVLALATRESLSETENGGGVALAVTYSFRQDSFTGWKREFVGHLIRQLHSAALVVGWSPKTKEYQVLAEYTGRNLQRIPTLGLLDEVQHSVGLHIPESLLVQGTLERRRRFDDQLAVQLWKHQRLEDLAQLLYEDVRLIRDLFVVAVNEGKLFYPAGPLGSTSEAVLALEDNIPEAVASVVRRRYRG